MVSDISMVTFERRNQLCQHPEGKLGGDSNGDVSPVVQVLYVLIKIVLNGHDLFRRVNIEPACCCESKPALAPVKERGAQFALQLGQILAQSGLGYKQFLRGFCHVLLFGYGQYITQVFCVQLAGLLALNQFFAGSLTLL